MSPRACRTLRGLHEGTPKQRCARRVFVEVGKRATARRRLPVFLQCAGLRRLTLRVMRHDPCRTYEDRNVTRSAKGCCVSGKK